MKSILYATLVALCLPIASFATKNTWTLSSPDGRIKAEIKADGKITYSLSLDGKTILAPSEIAMTLEDGTVFGKGKVKKAYFWETADKGIPAVAYKKAAVDDVYNGLAINFKGYSVEFRAYDNAVAYRFVSTAKKGSFNVKEEKTEFAFPEDWTSWVPYVRTTEFETFESQFKTAYNPNLGAALSLALMVLVLICVAIMNRFTGDDESVATL